jgi:hypothetical protein
MKSRRMVGAWLWFSVILGMVSISACWRAEANSCTLKMTLIVKDTQEGFAGTTGTVWTITPNCMFQVSRLFGQNLAEPHLKGTLTSEQQVQLSELLAKNLVAELPAQVGEASPVNARRITLEYGDKVSVLSMGPGDRDTSAIRSASPLEPSRRLLEVADGIEKMLGS